MFQIVKSATVEALIAAQNCKAIGATHLADFALMYSSVRHHRHDGSYYYASRRNLPETIINTKGLVLLAAASLTDKNKIIVVLYQEGVTALSELLPSVYYTSTAAFGHDLRGSFWNGAAFGAVQQNDELEIVAIELNAAGEIAFSGLSSVSIAAGCMVYPCALLSLSTLRFSQLNGDLAEYEASGYVENLFGAILPPVAYPYSQFTADQSAVQVDYYQKEMVTYDRRFIEPESTREVKNVSFYCKTRADYQNAMGFILNQKGAANTFNFDGKIYRMEDKITIDFSTAYFAEIRFSMFEDDS